MKNKICFILATVFLMADAGEMAPPTFLYYRGPDKMQVVYEYGLERPVPVTDDESSYEFEYLRGWEVQEQIRAHASEYSLLFADEPIRIRYEGETLKDPDGNDLDYGELHNMFIPSAGLHYKLVDRRKASSLEERSLYVIASEQYLDRHKRLAVAQLNTYRSDDANPLPGRVVSELERQYGVKCENSMLAATVGGWIYGVAQFEPQGEEVLALEVLMKGDKIYSFPKKGRFDSEMMSTWNVDDGGEYFASYISAAFEGDEGPELYYVRHAPESCNVGVMKIEGGKLVRRSYANYYVNIDEGNRKPFYKRDFDRMVALYNASDHDNQYNTLTKWCFIDIDSDGYDEVWLRDDADENGAFFTFKDSDNPQLICVESEKLSSQVYIGRIRVSGPAGGPSYYYADYMVADSKPVHALSWIEVSGEFYDGTYDGQGITAERLRQILPSLPQQEHYMKSPDWRRF